MKFLLFTAVFTNSLVYHLHTPDTGWSIPERICMRFADYKTFYLALLLFFAFPAVAPAAPTITCHCFTDRSYDPVRPAAADPYFLATAQNSFFAAAFNVEKRAIVVKKQKGASSDDLWVAYWLAARFGGDQETLLEERKSKGSWRRVAAPLALSGKPLGDRVAAALKANASDERLAAAMVDELLLRFRFHGAQELAALRKAGASSQEMILAGLIAAKTRQPAIRLYREVREGSATWGTLLQRAKIGSPDIQPEIAALITASGNAGSK